MRIGFNLLPYSPQGQGGAEVFIRNLVRELAENRQDIDLVLIVSKGSAGMYAKLSPNVRERIVVFPRVLGRLGRVVAEQLLVPRVARRQKLDVLYSNYVLPLLYRGTQIVNVHDMLIRANPRLIGELGKRYYWRFLVPLSMIRANVVYTVSAFSRSEIERYMPGVSNKVRVTVEGVDQALCEKSDGLANERTKSGVFPKRFVLSVGSWGEHKNKDGILKAFAFAARRDVDLHLVFVGSTTSPGASERVSRLSVLVSDLGLKERVHFVGFVSASTLASYYKSALAVILLSHYEGFGLPVLEAQYFECPVICSGTGALAEVAGDGAVLVDVNVPDEAGVAILNLAASSSQQGALIENGRENLGRFGWGLAADELVSACRALTDGN